MADRDVTIGLDVEGADESAKKVDNLSEEFRDVGDATTEAANDAEMAFADVEAELEAISREVKNLAGDMDKELGTDAVLAIRRNEQELSRMPEGVIRAFERAERASENFRRKVDEDAEAERGDVERLIKAQSLLNREIAESGYSIDDFGEIAKRRLQQTEDNVEDATREFKQLEDAVEQMDGQLRSSHQGFTSLDDALQQLPGTMGKVATSAAGMAAAFGVGVAAGSQLNQFFETDVQEWDSFMSSFSLRGKVAMQSFADGAIGALNLLGAAWDALWSDEVDIADVAKEWEAFKFTMLDSAAGMDAALFQNTNTLRKFAEENGIAHSSIQKTGEQTVETTAAIKAEELALLATTEALRKLTEQHGASILSMSEAGNQFRVTNEVLSASNSKVQQATNAYEDQKRKVDQLKLSHGENSLILGQAVEKLKSLKERLDQSRTAQEKASDAQTSAKTAYNTAIDKSQALEKAVTKQKEALTATTEPIKLVAEAAKKAAEDGIKPFADAAGDGATKVDTMRTAVLGLNLELDQTLIKTGAVAKALKDLDTIGAEGAE